MCVNSLKIKTNFSQTWIRKVLKITVNPENHKNLPFLANKITLNVQTW